MSIPHFLLSAKSYLKQNKKLAQSRQSSSLQNDAFTSYVIQSLTVAHLFVVMCIRDEYVKQLISNRVILKENIIRKCTWQINFDGFNYVKYAFSFCFFFSFPLHSYNKSLGLPTSGSNCAFNRFWYKSGDFFCSANAPDIDIHTSPRKWPN